MSTKVNAKISKKKKTKQAGSKEVTEGVKKAGPKKKKSGKVTQPNAGATGATGLWTPEEIARLTSAVANTSKKEWGNEYKTNWIAVAALVQTRSWRQCQDKCRTCKKGTVPNAGATGAAGSRMPEEMARLASAVAKATQRNAGATGATGLWMPEEIARLTSAVANTPKKGLHVKGDRTDWVTIAALVQTRSWKQCRDKCQQCKKGKVPNAGATGAAGPGMPEEMARLTSAVAKATQPNARATGATSIWTPEEIEYWGYRSRWSRDARRNGKAD